VLKRILIGVVVTLAVIALLPGSVVGYFWLRDAPERAKHRKEAEELVAGLVAQKKALDTLGDVDFDTAGLTLAQLNQKLNEPTLRKSGTHDSTVVGWACADRSCAIIASFMTPFGAGNSYGIGTRCRLDDEAHRFGHAYSLDRWSSRWQHS